MLFEESLIVTLPNRKQRRMGWYFAGTVIGYGLVALSAVVGSILLVNPEIHASLVDSVLVSPPPPPPPPPPPAAGGQVASQPAVTRIVTTAFVPPTVTPRQIPTVSDLPAVDAALVGGVPGGMPGGVPGGVVGGVLGGVVGGVLGAAPVAEVAPPPPTPAPEPPAPPAKPRPVSTGVLLGNSIRQAQAIYPQLARNAHVEGVVLVEIIVDEEGSVIAATALDGHPLLRQPAQDAARQWKFRPTLLNGRPIKIAGMLRFTFKLA